MSVHEELLKLIEALPESEIPVVKSFVEFVLSRTASKDSKAFLDPVLHALETAPEDDEPLTEEDLKAIAEGEEDIRQGRVTPWEDVKRDLGL